MHYSLKELYQRVKESESAVTVRSKEMSSLFVRAETIFTMLYETKESQKALDLYFLLGSFKDSIYYEDLTAVFSFDLKEPMETLKSFMLVQEEFDSGHMKYSVSAFA